MDHDCYFEGHAWEYHDDSFDHGLGAEIIIYRICEVCGWRENGPFSDDGRDL